MVRFIISTTVSIILLEVIWSLTAKDQIIRHMHMEVFSPSLTLRSKFLEAGYPTIGLDGVVFEMKRGAHWEALALFPSPLHLTLSDCFYRFFWICILICALLNLSVWEVLSEERETLALFPSLLSPNICTVSSFEIRMLMNEL